MMGAFQCRKVCKYSLPSYYYILKGAAGDIATDGVKTEQLGDVVKKDQNEQRRKGQSIKDDFLYLTKLNPAPNRLQYKDCTYDC